MLTKVLVSAPAKLNLTLDITGRREDGYHFMKMVMQAVDLRDEVSIELSGDGNTYLVCDVDSLVCDGSNLALRAADAFFSFTGLENPGLRIHIAKRIPVQKGLAGGSADAAAMLVGLDHLLDTQLDLHELCHIGLKVGADVPFCIQGGTMLAEGIGEILSPLPMLTDCHFVIATPKDGMCTTECFRIYDQRGSSRAPDTDSMVAALTLGDLELIGQNLCNVLEEVCPDTEVQDLLEVLREEDALGAAMSGSGTAVFGIFESARAARACQRKIVPYADFAEVCTPLRHGAVVISEE